MYGKLFEMPEKPSNVFAGVIDNKINNDIIQNVNDIKKIIPKKPKKTKGFLSGKVI